MVTYLIIEIFRFWRSEKPKLSWSIVKSVLGWSWRSVSWRGEFCTAACWLFVGWCCWATEFGEDGNTFCFICIYYIVYYVSMLLMIRGLRVSNLEMVKFEMNKFELAEHVFMVSTICWWNFLNYIFHNVYDTYVRRILKDMFAYTCMQMCLIIHKLECTTAVKIFIRIYNLFDISNWIPLLLNVIWCHCWCVCSRVYVYFPQYFIVFVCVCVRAMHVYILNAQKWKQFSFLKYIV